MSTKIETPQGAGTKDLLAVEASQALERIRASKNITRRGMMICGQTMAEMLRLGWKKEQLDALEIIFWSCRDGNGEVIKHSSANVEISHANPNTKPAPSGQ